MFHILLKNGYKHSIPEWNYLSGTEQTEICRKISEPPTNIIPFPNMDNNDNQIGEPEPDRHWEEESSLWGAEQRESEAERILEFNE